MNKIQEKRHQATVKADTTKFFKILVKMEPLEVLGVARILKIEIMKDKDTPRDFADVLVDIGAKFQELDRKKRRNLISLCKASHKGEITPTNSKEKEVKKNEV